MRVNSSGRELELELLPVEVGVAVAELAAAEVAAAVDEAAMEVEVA